MVALIVVTGSPGCGKSTWVRTVAQPGDIRFGTDEITNALTGKAEASHHHGNTQKKISRAARDAGIAEAIKHRHDVDVYILVSNLNREDEDRWRRHGAKFVIVDPGYATAMQRCIQHRPGYKRRLVDAWYSRQDQWPRDAEIICDFQAPDAVVEDDEPDVPDTTPAQLHVVIGPPASGKSTFVREHRAHGDITIDYDEIANTLAGLEPANHTHEPHIRAATKAARQAAIDTALRQTGGHRVWLIHSSPAASTLERYRSLGAQIHIIDPGKDVVMKRVKAQRPPHLLRVAAAWYTQDRRTEGTEPPRTTTERGYGHDHQQAREQLMFHHVDGTPCWWCGEPMYRDRTKNWDYDPTSTDPGSGSLHADHGNGKDAQASRLLHERCNKSRGDGSRDDSRPALQPAPEPVPPGETFQWASI